jgi:hypothetical protein
MMGTIRQLHINAQLATGCFNVTLEGRKLDVMR